MAVEASFEKKLCKFCKQQEWECLKLRIDGENGFPDRTILAPDGSVFFAELKAPTGSPRGRQKWWNRRLTSMGFNAGFYYDFETLKKDLKKWEE